MCEDWRVSRIHPEPDLPIHQRSHPGSLIQPSLVCKDCDPREGEREREREGEREGGEREGREKERKSQLFYSWLVIL